MDTEKLYVPEVLRNKVPTLHPRYQWMKLELEPDDRIVLTSISGHYTVAQIIELTGLTEDSVARVILKLVGRGVVLWDDALPFYDEEALLEVLPTFDPQNINRNAHLDDTDRMLLTFINGRTSVRQMEAALPLSRERLLASVIRLRLADVIGVAEPPAPAAAASGRDGGGASSYQLPQTSPPPRPAAPTPSAGVSARPAAAVPHVVGQAPSATPQPPSAPADDGAGGTGRVYKNRQDAFEEATRRLLSGESMTPEVPDFASPPAPRKGTGTVRDHEAPRYERKTGRTSEKEKREKKEKTRTAEVKAKQTARDERAGRPSALPKILKIAAVIGILLVVIALIRLLIPSTPPLSEGDMRNVIPISTIYPINAGKFTAQVAARWFDLSRDAKRDSMQKLSQLLKPHGVASIALSDEDGKVVAEWDTTNGITLYQ